MIDLDANGHQKRIFPASIKGSRQKTVNKTLTSMFVSSLFDRFIKISISFWLRLFCTNVQLHQLLKQKILVQCRLSSPTLMCNCISRLNDVHIFHPLPNMSNYKQNNEKMYNLAKAFNLRRDISFLKFEQNSFLSNYMPFVSFILKPMSS